MATKFVLFTFLAYISKEVIKLWMLTSKYIKNEIEDPIVK